MRTSSVESTRRRPEIITERRRVGEKVPKKRPPVFSLAGSMVERASQSNACGILDHVHPLTFMALNRHNVLQLESTKLGLWRVRAMFVLRL